MLIDLLLGSLGLVVLWLLTAAFAGCREYYPEYFVGVTETGKFFVYCKNLGFQVTPNHFRVSQRGGLWDQKIFYSEEEALNAIRAYVQTQISLDTHNHVGTISVKVSDVKKRLISEQQDARLARIVTESEHLNGSGVSPRAAAPSPGVPQQPFSPPSRIAQ